MGDVPKLGWARAILKQVGVFDDPRLLVEFEKHLRVRNNLLELQHAVASILAHEQRSFFYFVLEGHAVLRGLRLSPFQRQVIVTKEDMRKRRLHVFSWIVEHFELDLVVTPGERLLEYYVVGQVHVLQGFASQYFWDTLVSDEISLQIELFEIPEVTQSLKAN